jgi:hypothetical protein
MSLFLQYQCCFPGHQLVFSQAEDFFRKMNDISVSNKQIERVCHHYGEEFEADYSQGKLTNASVECVTAQNPAYVMMDGGMILTRQKEHPWKELKLGRIFHSRDHVKGIGKKRNLIIGSQYVGHLGGHQKFLTKLDFFIEEIANDSKVFIADGAPWIWNWVQDMYPDSTQILDFFHAKEHLCQFASLYLDEVKTREEWIKLIEKLLPNDQVEQVLDTLRNILSGITKKTAMDDLKCLIRYYQNNQQRMIYKTFKDKGYLIGSGAMESAIRNVVQQRLKRSGQRWTIEGGQQITNIRTPFLSDGEDKVIQKIKSAA